jgi:hypothetical protein
VNIRIVPVGRIAALLPQLLPYLAMSAEWSAGRATVDDILRIVLTGQAQLWVVTDVGADKIKGHLITEVKQYPRCKMFVVQYCAMATGAMEAVQDLMQYLAEQAARSAGCSGIEFIGRPGWRQTARNYGYTRESVSYQKFFEVQE